MVMQIPYNVKNTLFNNKVLLLIWLPTLIVGNIIVCYKMYIYQTQVPKELNVEWIPYNTDIPNDKYLVYNSKCHILDLHPWNQEVMIFYKKRTHKLCSNKPLLTKISKKEGEAFLVINKKAEKQYAEYGATCCYSKINRDMTTRRPDHSVKLSTCITFKDVVKITNTAIKVDCYTNESRIQKVYANTHASIISSEELRKRKHKFRRKKPISILLVGIDSVSNLNFVRTLPSTSNYIKKQRWINYKAYNKVGHNTFPNIMAILTGLSLQSIKGITNLKTNFLDVYNMIWKDFQRLGYVTAYVEDQANMNTFTFSKRGFKQQPTDFYFRDYTVITEQLKNSSKHGTVYCPGPESYGDRILNIARDFTSTFSKQPFFGFFWMNSFSHDDVNAPMKMDNQIMTFFHDLQEKGIMNSTLIIFLSDHGMRHGRIRHTKTGWLEERLPFLYFWVPKCFRKDHEREYRSLQENSKKLTTPYDVYMTLQHLLVLSGLNYTIKPSISCHNCTSLFKQIPSIRSCVDASIDTEFCTCISYKDIDSNHPMVMKAANFIIKQIRTDMFIESSSASKCAVLEIDYIRFSRIATNYPYHKTNTTHMLIQLETKPKTVLEAVVKLEEGKHGLQIHIQGSVQRLDMYRYNSWCVDIENIKKYCYCKKPIQLLTQNIMNWLEGDNKYFV